MKKSIAIICVETLAIIILSTFEGLEFRMLACFIGICLGISVYHLLSLISEANRKYKIFKRFYKEFNYVRKNANEFYETLEISANVVLRSENEMNRYKEYLSKKKREEIKKMAEEAKMSTQ